jgi:hypothetical protein
MNAYDASEQAYKRGYEQGKKDARKKGRWVHIVEDDEGGCYGFCSNCSAEHHAQSASALRAFHRYCRWCGADMRGEEDG